APLARTVLAALFALCSFLPTPAFAWGAKGHEIVGYIAEDHLTEAAREKIKALLKNETLVRAATWPDKIRKALPQMNALHYVDVRRGSSYYDRNLDCPERNCIVEAINWYLKVLTSTDSPLAEKQIALNYIVHLVGDLHQPLHVGLIERKSWEAGTPK